MTINIMQYPCDMIRCSTADVWSNARKLHAFAKRKHSFLTYKHLNKLWDDIKEALTILDKSKILEKMSQNMLTNGFVSVFILLGIIKGILIQKHIDSKARKVFKKKTVMLNNIPPFLRRSSKKCYNFQKWWKLI